VTEPPASVPGCAPLRGYRSPRPAPRTWCCFRTQGIAGCLGDQLGDNAV